MYCDSRNVHRCHDKAAGSSRAHHNCTFTSSPLVSWETNDHSSQHITQYFHSNLHRMYPSCECYKLSYAFLVAGLEYVAPKLSELAAEVSSLAAARGGALVYCFRGGMRSASFALLCREALAGAGDAYMLQGGYKAFRQAGNTLFGLPGRALLLVGGKTGSGKTQVIRTLGGHNDDAAAATGSSSSGGGGDGSDSDGAQHLTQQQQQERKLGRAADDRRSDAAGVAAAAIAAPGSSSHSSRSSSSISSISSSSRVEPVVDLEALANHKGSAFGALLEEPQPTFQQFENLLHMRCAIARTTLRLTVRWRMNHHHLACGRLISTPRLPFFLLLPSAALASLLTRAPDPRHLPPSPPPNRLPPAAMLLPPPTPSLHRLPSGPQAYGGRHLWLEDEGYGIGNVNLPKDLWFRMKVIMSATLLLVILMMITNAWGTLRTPLVETSLKPTCEEYERCLFCRCTRPMATACGHCHAASGTSCFARPY